MRKIVTIVALAVLPVSVMAADSYTIDSAHTFPNFTISHLGFSTMHGRFNKTTGKLSLDEAKGTGSVDVEIDAASVDTGFQRRDDDLRSPSFLNAVEFPKITYKSTKVTINKDSTGVVEGNLTIAGVTKPVTLNVKRIHCGQDPFKKTEYRCGFDAETTIKRSDFGVKYGLPAIGDEMNIALEVEAKRD